MILFFGTSVSLASESRSVRFFDVPSPSESSSLSITIFAVLIGEGDNGLCGPELAGEGLLRTGLEAPGLSGTSGSSSCMRNKLCENGIYKFTSPLYMSSTSPVGDCGAFISERGETGANGDDAADDAGDAPRDASSWSDIPRSLN
ncbi:hypothetical protein GCK72_014983 [Caenorhabditis remanei]|uniref:Uncharacterized protein n=1 Tax=Caenorhabditis remanei TaxID=31234 RepID=A0A6A5GVJ0_CAERE|nr:hypothetical protein GCK72_014983 [Caenorhabditis remanei]KAF1758525.1 hypothetical protein GCK72_014983 [Caenorhabditis remanei]